MSILINNTLHLYKITPKVFLTSKVYHIHSCQNKIEDIEQDFIRHILMFLMVEYPIHYHFQTKKYIRI